MSQAPRTVRFVCKVALCCSVATPSDGAVTTTPTVAPPLVHLDRELGAAQVSSGRAPRAARQERLWSFAEPQKDFRLASREEYPPLTVIERQQLEDGIRLALTAPGSFRAGGLEVDLKGLRFSEWQTVIVRARTSDRFAGVTVVPNLKGAEGLPPPMRFFDSADEAPPMFSDGSAQSYAIPIRSGAEDVPELLERITVLFAAPGPATVDVLSVELVPRGAEFLEDSGVRQVVRSGLTRRTLFAHTPARLTFPVSPGQGGRFDFGLTVNSGESVTYRVRHGSELVHEVTLSESGEWHQQSVAFPESDDGSVLLTLEADSEEPGNVALWGAPIVSAAKPASGPNVIFYVIDGGDADFMSLYEYGRPTTPFLEELAKEGVLFTRAHSNSTWTQPSTASFMTSLHHSVLGGLRRGVHSTSVPDEAVTMAEHFRNAGYQTASFTANPNAGRIIGTDQGMDLMTDVATEHHSTSSKELHEAFFQFRETYPGGPFWVHFQTTDVHEPSEPVPPFQGRFTTEEQLQKNDEWAGRIWQVAGNLFGTTSVTSFYDQALERGEIDRQQFFGTRRDLYDETMLHQDHTLEEFVARLKANGEWENTIFLLGSDHGHPAGTFARFGRGLFDPQPEPWEGALCDAYATRIPFLVIWPGVIEGGRRIDDPVSMIDVLPTLLGLAGLPAPEVLQGQSLAPLLRGEEQTLAPVILDEFRVDESTGQMIGNLEIIDGRWGASLEIGPVPEGEDPNLGRRSVPAGGRWGAVHPFYSGVPRLLLYDLSKDPYTQKAVNETYPEKVGHYRRLLEQQWQAHRALATRFQGGSEEAMTPEQLEQLRALGYIR